MSTTPLRGRHAKDEYHAHSNDVLKWFHAASIRAIKTAAQAALAVIGVDLIGIHQVPWFQVLSVSALAMVISYLTSISGLPEVEDYASLPQILSDENH